METTGFEPTQEGLQPTALPVMLRFHYYYINLFMYNYLVGVDQGSVETHYRNCRPGFLGSSRIELLPLRYQRKILPLN